MAAQDLPGIGTATPASELSNAITKSVEALATTIRKGTATSTSEEKRLFFPDGINYIKLAISLGSRGDSLVSAELTVSSQPPTAQADGEATIAEILPLDGDVPGAS